MSDTPKDIQRVEQNVTIGSLVPRMTTSEYVTDILTGQFVDGIFRAVNLPVFVTVLAGREDFLIVKVTEGCHWEIQGVQAVAEGGNLFSFVKDHGDAWELYWSDVLGRRMVPQGLCRYMFTLRKEKSDE